MDLRRLCSLVATLCFAVAHVPVASADGVRAPNGCTGIEALEKVSYSVAPARGGPRTRYVATLRNEGLCNVEYGNPFSIRIRKKGEWRPLTFGRGCVFTLEGYTLLPGTSSSQRVGWLSSSCEYRKLPFGYFRITKTIRTEQSDTAPSRERALHAFFRVTNH